jgi:hypothetical protein
MPDNHKPQMNHLYTSPMKCLEKALEAWELAQWAVMDLPADAPSVVRIDALKQLEMAHHAVAEQAKKMLQRGLSRPDGVSRSPASTNDPDP